ncbi:MAG: hypothetical protein ACTSWN_05485 [Promethearchaeota archaeon]
MYYSNRKVKIKRSIIIFSCFIPAILFGSFITVTAVRIFQFSRDLGKAEIDASTFIPANTSRLAEMARMYEFYLEGDHLPLNYTLTLYWDDNFSTVNYWAGGGDAAIWTGFTLTMACLRYAVCNREGDITELTKAFELVNRLLSGVELLLAVPNGGTGPGYPGVLARSVTPKDWVDKGNPPISGFPYGEPADNVDIFDGRDEYSNWYWMGYPSLDQYSGIIMALTFTLQLVDDDDIHTRAVNLAKQIVNHFRKTSFYLTDGNGRTTGQTFLWKPEHPGYWVLGLLNLGRLADPDAYTDLYYQYAYEQLQSNVLFTGTDLSIFSLFNYFSLNINWVMLYSLVMFETDPDLRDSYEHLVQDILYPQVRGHRNPWLNIAYLQMMRVNDSGIEADVKDQLMRFGIERIPGLANSTRVPDRGLNYSGGYYHGLIPDDWPRVSPPMAGFGSESLDEQYLLKPKTAEYYQCGSFIWQRSPFRISEYSPAHRQDSGISFLLPYYMARYHGII